MSCVGFSELFDFKNMSVVKLTKRHVLRSVHSQLLTAHACVIVLSFDFFLSKIYYSDGLWLNHKLIFHSNFEYVFNEWNKENSHIVHSPSIHW